MDIEKLEKTLGFMRELKPEQFDYSSFVADSVKGCGTVCCIAGWHPKWYPEGPLRWIERKGEVILNNVDYVPNMLGAFYNIDDNAVWALFYGHVYYSTENIYVIIPGIRSDSPLQKVIERWEAIIADLKTLQNGH